MHTLWGLTRPRGGESACKPSVDWMMEPVDCMEWRVLARGHSCCSLIVHVRPTEIHHHGMGAYPELGKDTGSLRARALCGQLRAFLLA
eukprot:254727-Chlamydomonas_euryale.AAC.1